MMDPSDYFKISKLDGPQKIFDLTNRAGIITGGSGKMGQQFATVLAKAGAKVIISDIDEKKCHEIALGISESSSGEVIGVGCDVTNETQVRNLFERTSAEVGQLDFLINNVMSKPPGYYRPFFAYGTDTWENVLKGNLTGTYLCCREAAKMMKKNKSGSIVITSSIYGLVGPDQRVYEGGSNNPYDKNDPLSLPCVYSVSKGGLNMLAKHLATLFGPDQIRVNVLVPGGVYDHQETSFHEAYVNRTPLGRMAVWSDYNGAILFLVSNASRYMTGANLVVDGGWTAW